MFEKKRQFDSLKGNALKGAAKVVNKFGSINTSGFYGSLKIDEKYFVKKEEVNK